MSITSIYNHIVFVNNTNDMYSLRTYWYIYIYIFKNKIFSHKIYNSSYPHRKTKTNIVYWSVRNSLCIYKYILCLSKFQYFAPGTKNRIYSLYVDYLYYKLQKHFIWTNTTNFEFLCHFFCEPWSVLFCVC